MANVPPISGQQTSRAILFSGLSILVYDHLLLLSLEIEKIWKAKESAVKWIYIANRAINWIVVILILINNYGTALSTSFCRGSAAVTIILGITVFTINQWILLLRVDACYHKKRTKIIMTWFAITVSLEALLGVMLMRDLVSTLVFVPVMHCIPMKHLGTWTMFINAPNLLFETTMCIAMIWRYACTPGKDIGGRNSLLYAIFHNAVVYFLFILVIGLSSFFLSKFGPPSVSVNVGVLVASLTTSAISRSILDLRSLGSITNDTVEISQGISLSRQISRTIMTSACITDYEQDRPIGLSNTLEFQISEIPV